MLPTSWLLVAAALDPPPLFSQAPRVRVRECRCATVPSRRVPLLPFTSQRRYQQTPTSASVLRRVHSCDCRATCCSFASLLLRNVSGWGSRHQGRLGREN
ncbi:hypothetical protein NDU88_003840 [Pleurodeles waltl]|uniref:Secreted protein n=1 Tax=Pleurodeles waltl TaxID=8319 RepID=A0AAV7TQ68_PLEWA|nr:hypothetical protein NDU88_003840 [Pleurodeles waltl]